MKILGIDPGNKITGLGLIDGAKGTKFHFLTYNILECQMSYPDSLVELPTKVEAFLIEHRPDLASIEGPKDIKGFISHQRQVEIIGCYKSLLVRHRTPFIEIPPSSMKKIITGNGFAEKEEVARRIADYFNISFDQLVKIVYYKQGIKKGQIKSYILDGTDALGLAMAALIYYDRVGEYDYAGRS